jgi:acetyl esterase/lipase
MTHEKKPEMKPRQPIPPVKKAEKIRKVRRRRKLPLLKLVLLFALLEMAAVAWLLRSAQVADAPASGLEQPPAAQVEKKPGDVISREVQVLSGAQATAVIRHNYPGGVPGEGIGIKKITFKYRSQLPSGELISVVGRAYLPNNNSRNLPIFAFAPGTTGVADTCATSLEKPSGPWGAYDSHMSAYASQGYATVTTDYEGMRDPGRLHHYMVGELEGRALLDAIRGLRNLPEASGRFNPNSVFLGGYSQGGHAAFWADKIAAKYAPDVQPLGVVGWGPVMSVKQTLTDVTHAANINWFGPNVLVSYRDYYKESYPGILLTARENNLRANVLAHCIDTDLSYWGHNPAVVYTPEFIQSALDGTFNDRFPQFAQDLDANAVGSVPTQSAKLINEGELDNVVLPAQQTAALPALCASSKGPVQYKPYPQTTHYNAMLHSFGDTLAWMKNLSAREAVISTCT